MTSWISDILHSPYYLVYCSGVLEKKKGNKAALLWCVSVSSCWLPIITMSLSKATITFHLEMCFIHTQGSYYINLTSLCFKKKSVLLLIAIILAFLLFFKLWVVLTTITYKTYSVYLSKSSFAIKLVFLLLYILFYNWGDKLKKLGKRHPNKQGKLKTFTWSSDPNSGCFSPQDIWLSMVIAWDYPQVTRASRKVYIVFSHILDFRFSGFSSEEHIPEKEERERKNMDIR